MEVQIPENSSFDDIHKIAKNLVYTDSGVVKIQCEFDFFLKQIIYHQSEYEKKDLEEKKKSKAKRENLKKIKSDVKKKVLNGTCGQNLYKKEVSILEDYDSRNLQSVLNIRTFNTPKISSIDF